MRLYGRTNWIFRVQFDRERLIERRPKSILSLPYRCCAPLNWSFEFEVEIIGFLKWGFGLDVETAI